MLNIERLNVHGTVERWNVHGTANALSFIHVSLVTDNHTVYLTEVNIIFIALCIHNHGHNKEVRTSVLCILKHLSTANGNMHRLHRCPTQDISLHFEIMHGSRAH